MEKETGRKYKTNKRLALLQETRGDKRHQRESLLYQNAMGDQEEKHTPSRERGGEGMGIERK